MNSSVWHPRFERCCRNRQLDHPSYEIFMKILLLSAAILSSLILSPFDSAIGDSVHPQEAAALFGGDDLPAVGSSCLAGTTTCPAKNYSGPTGGFCGGGAGSGCTSCSDEQGQEEHCHLSILDWCTEDSDSPVLCGSSYNGTCYVFYGLGGAAIMSCKKVGGPTGTCQKNLTQCM